MPQSRFPSEVGGYGLCVAQNLAYRLCSAFKGFPDIRCDRERQSVLLKGRLALASDEFETKAVAQCLIGIGPAWMDTPPPVCCEEPWMKRGNRDWHVSEDGYLCWDFDGRWKDSVSGAIDEGTVGHGAEFGAAYLLRSVRNLLNRHLFAHRSGITSWRKEWDFWAHDEAGAAEYQKTLKTTNAGR